MNVFFIFPVCIKVLNKTQIYNFSRFYLVGSAFAGLVAQIGSAFCPFLSLFVRKCLKGYCF